MKYLTLDQLADHLHHLGDKLGRAGLLGGRKNAQRRHILQPHKIIDQPVVPKERPALGQHDASPGSARPSFRELVHDIVLERLELGRIDRDVASRNHDAEVAELSQYYLQLVPFCYGMMAVPLLLAQTLNALAKPMHAMVINLVRLFGFMLPAIFLGALSGSSKVIFLAIIIAHTLAGLASLVLLAYLMRQQLWWRHQQ